MAGAFTHNGNVVEGLPSIASQINYSNTSSRMQATQVQAAIDELNTNKQPKTDNNLTTTSKETTGAINELKSGLTNLFTVLTVVSNDSEDVTDIDFPDGYYASNCIVLAVAIIADPSINLRMWGEFIDNNNATGHYVYVDPYKLHLVVRDTDDWGKTFNIILTKKSLY